MSRKLKENLESCGKAGYFNFVTQRICLSLLSYFFVYYYFTFNLCDTKVVLLLFCVIQIEIIWLSHTLQFIFQFTQGFHGHRESLYFLTQYLWISFSWIFGKLCMFAEMVQNSVWFTICDQSEINYIYSDLIYIQSHFIYIQAYLIYIQSHHLYIHSHPIYIQSHFNHIRYHLI